MLASVGNSYGSYAVGQDAYTSQGTYSWVCPDDVSSISVLCVGAGGFGGGGLGYKNNIAVTSGTSYTVRVGPHLSAASNNAPAGDSYFVSTSTVKGGGGSGSSGGTYTGDGGGNGGSKYGGAGGGAGGYSGNGGSGGTSPSGGAGGGGTTSGLCGHGSGGGGVGILGEGSSGSHQGWASSVYGQSMPAGGGGSGGYSGGGTTNCAYSGGYSYHNGGGGGSYGGGGGEGFGKPHGYTGKGAVRILYPGHLRSFPSTRTTDES